MKVLGHLGIDQRRHVGYVVGKCWVRVHAVCAWPMSRPPKEKQ